MKTPSAFCGFEVKWLWLGPQDCPQAENSQQSPQPMGPAETGEVAKSNEGVLTHPWPHRPSCLPRPHLSACQPDMEASWTTLASPRPQHRGQPGDSLPHSLGDPQAITVLSKHLDQDIP